MFEFDKYEDSRPGPRSVPDRPYTPFDNFRERALLQWGEHCVECAAPDCFTSCDLYDPRPDRRCRRFAYGIFRNTDFPSASGAGAEVVFRRWGKLEARANARLFSAAATARMERMLLALSPLGNRLGRLVDRAVGDIRWSYLTFGLLERLNARLHDSDTGRRAPDAFVAEIYNPTDETAELLLTMTVDRTRIRKAVRADQLPRPFMRKLELAPGYNLIEVPYSEFAEILGSGLPFGITLSPQATEGTHLVFLCLDLVRYRTMPENRAVADGQADAARRVNAKCVIFDLDNTLWDGVLLEGDVTLRHEVAELMRRLDERGILVSVASKNSHEDAMAKLKEFGLADYLLYPQINWSPKSMSIAEIAKRLDIGIDTFVFVDDNPFEREEVSRAHPKVEVVDERDLLGLLEHDRLQGSGTTEARKRRRMYQEAQQREEASVTFGEDYIGFLRSCDITLSIFDVVDDTTERIVELVQRTNQLNFSGRKYSRDAFRDILADDSIRKTAMSCSDKFGDYGIIGVCIWRREGDCVIVDDLMISCRVQGKFIEQALFYHLLRRTTPFPARIRVNFKKTDRNALAQAVLTKLGFDLDTEKALERAVDQTSFETDFIHIV